MNNDSTSSDNKSSVAFLIPSTTRGRSWVDIKKTYLFNTFLGSMDRSPPSVDVVIYIGYDTDDPIYSRFEERQIVSAVFSKFRIKWVEMNPPVGQGNVVAVWNKLGEHALANGHEYLMVLGDDIVVPKDPAWLKVFLKDLKRNNNFGWSAGWSNNDAIATQFLIHKTLIDIFGFIFPPSLRNYFCDDFLNNIYPSKYKNWRKNYHLLNTGGEPRYTPLNDKVLCDMLVKRHTSQIARFLNQMNMINI